MIEARVPWTLEGPDDSITFDPRDASTVFMLASKPRTTVEDRRDVYDYPLDDGSHVSDAYAGHRMWMLNGRLRASSHSERNTEMQRLNALLNSLRREDGLLKWTPTGFVGVQSTVRRMGSVDWSDGAGYMQKFSFGLIAGDPRVYSQTEHTDSVGPATAALGANLMSANQASMETDASAWTAMPVHGANTHSSAQAHAGTDSVRVLKNAAGSISSLSTTSTAVAITTEDVLRASIWVRSDSAVNITVTLYGYDATDAATGYMTSTPTAAAANTWTEAATGDLTVPAGTTYVKMYVSCTVSTGLPGDYFTTTKGYYVDDAWIKGVTYDANLSIDNDGDASSAPRYVLTGAATNPKVANVGASESLTLATSIAAAATLTIDTAAREIYTGAALTAASNAYSSKPAASPWPLVYPGANPMLFQASSTDGTTEMDVYWRDAWMP